MVVWNSHVAENYYHTLRRCEATCSLYHFKSTEHNSRTKLLHFFSEHRHMEFASRISRARFPAGISFHGFRKLNSASL